MEAIRTTFTQQELAERWGVTKQVIKNMENDRRLKRLHNLPGVRYRAREVYALEGMDEKDWEMMTPFERRKLTQELETAQQEIERLRAVLSRIVLDASEFMHEEAKKKVAVAK